VGQEFFANSVAEDLSVLGQRELITLSRDETLGQ
jgi:hypothetical protein